MWLEISQKYSGIKRTMIREYLDLCESCLHHEPLKRTDIVRNIRSKRPWERIQIDLVDLRKFSTENNGYSWILNVIDVFSKFLFSFKLNSKNSKEVSECMKNLLKMKGLLKLCNLTTEKNLLTQQ